MDAGTRNAIENDLRFDQLIIGESIADDPIPKLVRLVGVVKVNPPRTREVRVEREAQETAFADCGDR
jgi:hypothetical protein